MNHPLKRRPLLLASVLGLFAIAAGPLVAVAALAAMDKVDPVVAIAVGIAATLAAVLGYKQLRAYRDEAAMDTVRQLLDDDTEVDHLLSGFDSTSRKRRPGE